MTASWTTIRVTPSTSACREAVSEAMFACGAGGLQEIEESFVTHLDGAVDLEAFLRAVRQADPEALVNQSPMPIVDWTEHWRSQVSAHRLGPLTIAPPWLGSGDHPDTIVIDPGMAFGTGEHPTTRGCVRLMAGAIRSGHRVADLGAGSGILSIAAAKLGARSIYAIEVDPDAMGNAESNIARNRVGASVSLFEGDAFILLPLLAPVDVVIANIISSVLIELLPTIEGALVEDGRVILSGILEAERAAMVESLTRRGWIIEDEDHEEQWWTVRVWRGSQP